MAKRGNGEGSIYYSESLKRWVGQYTYNSKRKSIYGKTRTEVKDKLNKSLVNIADNKFVDKSKFTMLDIIAQSIEEEFKSNKISATSYNRKLETKKIIEKKFDIANMTIQKINSSDINKDLLLITNYSNSTIIKVSQMIRYAFDKALILNIVTSNPYTIKGLINIPKSSIEDKKIDSLTIEEQKLFIKELEKGYDKYTNIFFVAIYTGMRIGEILALCNDDIDLKNNIIRINKTLTRNLDDKYIVGKTTKTYAGTRDIPITPLIKDIFSNLNYNYETIFNNEGKIIIPCIINSHFKKICKNAGIRVYTTSKRKLKSDISTVNLNTSKVNTHMLRHTYATRCIESGMNATVLSKLLGHADIQTTLNTYTSVFNRFKEDEIQKYLDYITQLH